MNLTELLTPKHQGNAAFKVGDYPNAIGHYTTAILADDTDATYPLNRAAAYLKLGKYVPQQSLRGREESGPNMLPLFRNEDAERDCTTVLTSNASNVKALFRRGQARMEQNKHGDAQHGTQFSTDR